jgi:hypothetical protein
MSSDGVLVMGHATPRGNPEAKVSQQLGLAMRAHRRALRRGSGIFTLLFLLVVEGLLIIGIRSDSSPYRWVMGVQILVPFIAPGAVWRFPELVSFGCGWADKYVVWTLLAPLLAVTARLAFYYVNLLQETPIVVVASIAGTILSLSAGRIDPALSGLFAKHGRLILIWSLFFSILYFYAAIFELNAVFDNSPVLVYRSRVIAKSYVSGLYFHPEYQLAIGPWDSEGGTRNAAVPRRIFSTVHVGDTVCVIQKTGWLGIGWYVVQACSRVGGPVSLGDVGRSR